MISTGVARGIPNPLHQMFPQRLRKARKARGMHPTGLTLAAGLGGSMVALLEGGRSLPRLPTAECLARALGVSPGWLAYGLGDAADPAEPGALSEGLAARAKAVRAALALSMREVARRAKLTEGAVRSAERGTMPSIKTAEALAGALGVSPAWLAFGEGPQELPGRRHARQLLHALSAI